MAKPVKPASPKISVIDEGESEEKVKSPVQTPPRTPVRPETPERKRSEPPAASSSSSSSSSSSFTSSEPYASYSSSSSSPFSSSSSAIPDTDVDTENLNADVRRQKKELIFRLNREFSHERADHLWGMHMPLYELKYDYFAREEARKERDAIALMKEVLCIVFFGIQVANRKIGPILQLDGWAEACTGGDMERYNRPLAAIYARYFRKKEVNPLVELLWLIAGSAVMWHLQHRLPGQGDRQGDDIRPPPPRSRRSTPSSAASSSPGGGLASILRMFMPSV